MMIFEDAAKRPDLFLWFGAIDPALLAQWLARHHLVVRDDLFELWTRTGGGDIFESETLLGPFGNEALGDDILGVNQYAHEQGLPANYLIFHTGIVRSAIRMSDRRIVTVVRADHTVIAEFESLDRWYVDLLRSEFAERYGLV
jgi:hypothetical protein